MNLKETLMRLFGRRKPAVVEPPAAKPVHPNDDVRESVFSLVDQIDKAHEEKLSRSMEMRQTNGAGR